MGFHGLVNTAQFSEAAKEFKANGGVYTRAPIGSREYIEYWEEQERRCREGFWSGGMWIPGRYYAYLNFSVMSKVPDKIALQAYNERKNHNGKISIRTAEKILDFPRFWEPQYEWHMFKHISWNGGEFMGVKSPGGKHIGCLKARGGGFSYMEGFDNVYNYTFIDGSKSYCFAGNEGYLTKDGILNKTEVDLNWINEHIHEWKKNRQVKNTLPGMHFKASYIDANGQERGSMSEIIGVIVDDPNKTRGKRGRKITFEEFGSFKNGKKALEISLGSIKDGAMYVGQQVAFGTGGEEGPGIEALEEVFDNPDIFDMLEFPNIWEGENLEGTTCGYFCPAYRVNNAAIDEEGNVDMEVAIAHEKQERKRRKKSKDPTDLDRYIAEYPWTPKEALKRIANNPFQTTEISNQIRYVKTSSYVQSILRYGYMTMDPVAKKPVFIVQPKDVARPIETYPHKMTDDLKGCLTVAQEPYRNHKGEVPAGLYQITFDGFAIEEAEDQTSLFCIRVWKNLNNYSKDMEELPVAWWRGRPEDLNDVYYQLMLMCDYWNASAQGEIAGGGQGVYNYFKLARRLDRLDKEPTTAANNEVETKNRQTSYLMSMATDRKRTGLTYLVSWHKRARHIAEDGSMVKNIHRYYDLVGLLEMSKFNGKRNADTISADIIAMYMLKENEYNETANEEPEEEPDSFFNRPLFGDDTYTGSDEKVLSLG